MKKNNYNRVCIYFGERNATTLEEIDKLVLMNNCSRADVITMGIAALQKNSVLTSG
jgi:hypothetical protein